MPTIDRILEPSSAEKDTIARLGVGVSLRSRQRTAGHLARALARVMTPELRARCRAVAEVAEVDYGLEMAAESVERMGQSVANARP